MTLVLMPTAGHMDRASRKIVFGAISPLFFPRQAGAFHFVAASAYLIEHFRYRGILILLTTKSIAVVFLGVMTALGGMPWIVPFSGVADGLMGLLAFLAHRAAQREPAGGPA